MLRLRSMIILSVKDGLKLYFTYSLSLCAFMVSFLFFPVLYTCIVAVILSFLCYRLSRKFLVSISDIYDYIDSVFLTGGKSNE